MKVFKHHWCMYWLT